MDYRKNVDSDTGLDHCSKNGRKSFTSNHFFAYCTKDLQTTSLHSLAFLVSTNVAFTVKSFLLSRHTETMEVIKMRKYLTFFSLR